MQRFKRYQSRKKLGSRSLLLLLLTCMACSVGAQSNQKKILSLRQASNEALKAFDHAQFLSYLTDDVQITTGSGTLIQGKSGLRNYLEEAVGDRIYFVRTSAEVVVNAQRGLAWETGTWNGYAAEQEARPIAAGKYAAQWTMQNGTWRIRSELFVTLE
jgi:ketosteroid isomerase-like protein